MALLQSAYIGSGVTESVRIRRAEAAAKKSIRWIGAKRLLAQIVMPSVVRKETRYGLVDRMVSHPHADALFDKYRPALLVASSPGLIFAEVPLLRTAVRRGVRSMAVDPSWDNFTNKLLPVRRVNRLIVWNDVMKAQAIDLHGYQPDEVLVAGAPQWDVYFRSTRRLARGVFPGHRRRSVAQADHAVDDAARAVSAPRSRRARPDSRDDRRRLAVAGPAAGAAASARRHVRIRRVPGRAARDDREALPGDARRLPATAWRSTSRPRTSSTWPTRCATATSS